MIQHLCYCEGDIIFIVPIEARGYNHTEPPRYMSSATDTVSSVYTTLTSHNSVMSRSDPRCGRKNSPLFKRKIYYVFEAYMSERRRLTTHTYPLPTYLPIFGNYTNYSKYQVPRISFIMTNNEILCSLNYGILGVQTKRNIRDFIIFF